MSDDSDEQDLSVVAHCTDCGDEHPLGDRSMDETTTVCPHCGSTSYSTESIGTQSIKPDSERIEDAVRDVDGVGEQTVENILSTFATYYDFLDADARELRHINGVGKKTAERIIKSR